MTHVSKHKLKSTEEKRIIDAFIHSIFSASLARGKARVQSILTPTEKVMLAKRLAIITMLNQKHSYYRISESLHVSVSTVARLDRTFQTGAFDPLCRIFNRNLSFIHYLELFLAAGLPSMGGGKYQKHLDVLRSGRKPRTE